MLEVMREVVNIRHYENKQIPKQIQNDLFTAFSVAYSSGNVQPWEVLVVEGNEQYEKVVQATLAPDLNVESFGGQTWIKKAPLVCIVMMDKKRALARVGERGLSFAIEDISFAIQNFRLVAHLHGLKTACVREFDEDTLKSNLNLPWYIKPLAIVTAGYGERKKGLPPLLDVKSIVKRGTWE